MRVTGALNVDAPENVEGPETVVDPVIVVELPMYVGPRTFVGPGPMVAARFAMTDPSVAVYGAEALTVIIDTLDEFVTMNPDALDVVDAYPTPTLATMDTALAVIRDTPLLEFARIRTVVGYVAVDILYNAAGSVAVPDVMTVVEFDTLYVHVCTPSNPVYRLYVEFIASTGLKV